MAAPAYLHESLDAVYAASEDAVRAEIAHEQAKIGLVQAQSAVDKAAEAMKAARAASVEAIVAHGNLVVASLSQKE